MMLEAGLYRIRHMNSEYEELVEVFANEAKVIACSEIKVMMAIEYPLDHFPEDEFDVEKIEESRLPLFVSWPWKDVRYMTLLREA